MNSFLQLLSKYKETSKVGQANLVKPGQNVIIASQRIGYPDQLNKSIEIFLKIMIYIYIFIFLKN